MKKYFSLFIIAGLVFALAPAAKAEIKGFSIPDQAAIKAEKRAEIEKRIDEAKAKRAEFEARIEAKKAEVEAKRAEREAKVTAKKQEIVKKQAQQVAKKLNDFVKRLNDHYNKISNRVAKLSETHDTTELENLLAIARAKIDAAAEEVAKVNAAAEEIVITNQESFRAAVETLHHNANTAKEALRGAHSALVEVVKATKPGLLKEKETKSEGENETEE